MKPCLGHAALYDIVLFDNAPSTERQQAIPRAAALCASCPSPCEQKVTTDGQLVLLEKDWTPARKKAPAPKGAPTQKKKSSPKPAKPQQQPAATGRIAEWAALAAELKAAGRSLPEIAASLLVTEDLAGRLIDIGNGWPEHGHEPSYSEYTAHKRRGEEACEGCKAAKRDYYNRYYAANREQIQARRRNTAAPVTDAA